MICQAYTKKGKGCKCTNLSQNYSFYCGKHKLTDSSRAFDFHYQESWNNFKSFTNMNPSPDQHFELAEWYYQFENERKENEKAYIRLFGNDMFQMWGKIRENNSYCCKMKINCTIEYIQHLLTNAHQ